jgi:hypothetical protein
VTDNDGVGEGKHTVVAAGGWEHRSGIVNPIGLQISLKVYYSMRGTEVLLSLARIWNL